MACSCKKQKTTATKSYILAFCTNCDAPLTTTGGMLVPVHLVQVAVTKQDVDAWKANGYEIEVA